MTTIEKLKKLRTRGGHKTIVKSKELSGFTSLKGEDEVDVSNEGGEVVSYLEGETISLGNFAFRRFNVKLECFQVDGEDIFDEVKRIVQLIARIIHMEIKRMPLDGIDLDKINTHLNGLVLFIEVGETIPKEKYESRKFDIGKSIAILDGSQLKDKYLQLDSELGNLIVEAHREALE